jgi:IclR family mhp operon transcriptional activator
MVSPTQTKRAADQTNDSGIRSIGRSLRVLQVINQHRSLTMSAIAAFSDLPYPTTCRIVRTLMAEQMIEREASRKHYRPTEMVKTLSSGYHDDDDLARASRLHIEHLTRTIKWPISVCTRVGMSMMIRDSTHAIAPFTLNLYHPGYTMPILGSSSGKVHLAFSAEQDRELALDYIRRTQAANAPRIISQMLAEFGLIHEKGFATYDRISHTANPGKTSAISVPILLDGICQGTLTLAFFASTMSMQEAIKAYVRSMKQTALAIETNLLKLRETDKQAFSGARSIRA